MVKKRVQPVRRKVKHLDWIVRWLVRTHDCAICGEPLVNDFDPRNPGKSITLHHTEGSREEDRWEDFGYVKGMVICHSTCHRSFHLTLRHKESGKNYDKKKLALYERNIRKALRKQGL
jgi:hypothetical protein